MRERIAQAAVHTGDTLKPVQLGIDAGNQTKRVRQAASRSAGSDDRAADGIRRGRRSVVKDVCEQTVVENPVARTEHGLVVAQDPRPEPWRVGKPDAGGKVVLVRLLREDARERTPVAKPRAEINGWELQDVLR